MATHREMTMTLSRHAPISVHATDWTISARIAQIAMAAARLTARLRRCAVAA
jgi:hypothetical protein